MATKPVRTERIEARLTPEALALVRRAAEMEGRSLSEFVVAAATKAAQDAISERTMIILAEEESRRFVELLQDPPPMPEGLKRAKESHRRLFGSD